MRLGRLGRATASLHRQRFRAGVLTWSPRVATESSRFSASFPSGRATTRATRGPLSSVTQADSSRAAIRPGTERQLDAPVISPARGIDALDELLVAEAAPSSTVARTRRPTGRCRRKNCLRGSTGAGVDEGDRVGLDGQYARRRRLTLDPRSPERETDPECRRSRDDEPAARITMRLPPASSTGKLLSLKRGARRPDKLGTGRIPVVGRLRQRGREYRVEGRRKLGPKSVIGGGGSFRWANSTDSSDSLSNGRCAGQALEEDAAERVDVGPTVDRAALDLLRWDVVDRADEATLGGQAADGADVAGEPEVADVGVFSPSLRRCDQDVPGLHVAVDEAGRMRCIERVATWPIRSSARSGSSRPSRRSRSRRSEPSTWAIAR